MEFPADSLLLRIGELSRRLGVSNHVLRGWANRHGLLQLHRNGWRIGYLRAGTPAEELERAAARPARATRSPPVSGSSPPVSSESHRPPAAIPGSSAGL